MVNIWFYISTLRTPVITLRRCKHKLLWCVLTFDFPIFQTLTLLSFVCALKMVQGLDLIKNSEQKKFFSELFDWFISQNASKIMHNKFR